MDVLAFLLLATALVAPFWVLGAAVTSPADLPLGLPASALGVVAPAAAALLLTWRADGIHAAVRSIGRWVDPRGIGIRWWVAALLVMPAVVGASWVLAATALDRSVPPPSATPLRLLSLAALFLVPALLEEAGWTGYAQPRLLRRLPALDAALVLAAGWAAWHVIPWLQTRPDPAFAAWQVAGAFGLRVVLVWLSVHARGAVLVAAVAHASVNVAEAAFFPRAADYDPALMAVLSAVAAAGVALAFGRSLVRRAPS